MGYSITVCIRQEFLFTSKELQIQSHMTHALLSVELDSWHESRISTALRAVANRDSYKYIPVKREDLNTIAYSGDCVILAPAAAIKMGKCRIDDLRKRCPLSKIIVFAGDSHYYLAGYENGAPWELYDIQQGYEYLYPGEVDLHLDLMQSVVDEYTRRGIRAASWDWSVCQHDIDDSLQYRGVTKDHNFIFLGNLCSQYRRIFTEVVKSNKYSIITSGMFPVEQTPRSYARADVCIGSTSPVFGNDEVHAKHVRSMKGARDWIAPFHNTVLIYDNFDEVVNRWHSTVLYNYFSPSTICDAYEYIQRVGSKDILERQRQWAVENTLDKQFSRFIKSVL